MATVPSISEMARELGLLRAAMRASGDVVYEWNFADDTIVWRGSAAELFGVSSLSAIAKGDGFGRRIHPEDLARRVRALSQHCADHEPFDCEYRVRTGKGRFIWVHERGLVEFSPAGKPQRLTGTLRTITERKQQEARLEYRANYDELTGHYNHIRLREALEHQVILATRFRRPSGYLVFAIDRLGMHSDAYGAEVTDRLILEISQRIERNVRASDLIGRIGENRFGVVLAECGDAGLAVVADKIVAAVEGTPVSTQAGGLHVTVSAGGIIFPTMADTAQDAMNKAESALNDAQSHGQSHFVSYTMGREERADRRRHMDTAGNVRKALTQGRLAFAYQPIVDAATHAVTSYECLIRMRALDGSIVPAAQFIGVAENFGLVSQIDRRALELAVDELRQHPGVVLALNISGLTVSDQSWLRLLVSQLRDKPELAQRLTIEITETAALHDLEESARFISTARDLGCVIALDDFGAGYTSFRHLKSLPVDIVKIDGAFVRNLAENFDDQLFVRTLLGLANAFGLRTVAECVESIASARILTNFGVHFLQGWHFGKPTLVRPWFADDDKIQEGRADDVVDNIPGAPPAEQAVVSLQARRDEQDEHAARAG